MAERFRKSGKEKLILLLASDHDPDGEQISHSFARSMRDDFEIENIHPIKVAITAAQIAKYKLPSILRAKKSSSNHAKFVKKHGDDVWEIDALPPDTLQEILTEAIESVLDMEAFNQEVESEQTDASWLSGVRRTVLQTLREADLEIDFDEDDEDDSDEEEFE